MSNPRQVQVIIPTVRVPDVTDYRPLFEVPAGRLLVPGRCEVSYRSVDLDDEDATTTTGTADIEVELVDRRYRVQRLSVESLDRLGVSASLMDRAMNLSGSLSEIGHLVRFERQDGNDVTVESTRSDPLLHVAAVYSVAFAMGSNPTSAVAAAKGVKVNAAAQWVRRAREAGYLPPTTKGRAS
jgi:hypothetical protein